MVVMSRVLRVVLFLCLLILVSGAGVAITTYDVDVQGDSALVNVSFELYADQGNKINYWTATWTAPENAEILGVRDSQGAIDEYTVHGSTLSFETNRGPRRSKEVVDVQLRVDNILKEQYRGLDLVTLRLSGFSDKRRDVPDEVTQVTVRTDRELLSESHSHGFDYALNSHGAQYRGAGPINLHLAISDAGEEYEHYTLFGDANLSEADSIYWLVPAVTGFVPDVNSYPVIVLPDSTYDEKVDTWSAGQYRTGGLIFLRESTTEKDEMPAIVLHEVMHAYNEHALRWTNTGLAWFDEGTAKYVEYLVKHEKGIRQAEIFGDDVTWTGACKDRSGRCRFSLPPRGTPDQLWTYYQQDGTSMYGWKPSESTTAERRFGYAFAELLVRDYVRQHGFDALQETYQQLLTQQRDQQASKQDETMTVLEMMDTDFTPCYEDGWTRDELETCLETVNAMDPTIPSAVTVNNTQRTIDIQPIERPEPRGTVIDQLGGSTDTTSLATALSNVLYAVEQVVTGLFTNLFKGR